MLDILDLLWRFLAAQPLVAYLSLVPWHLQLLLTVLGLLAAGGLHHLLGFTFRFYRLRSGHAHWLGAPTLALLLVSVQALLAAYVVGTHADALLRPTLALDSSMHPASVLGEILLDPPFDDPVLSRLEEIGVSKDRLAATVRALPAESYRAGLRTFLVSPALLTLESPGTRLVPDAEPGKARGGAPGTPAPPDAAPERPLTLESRDDIAAAALVQIALRRLMDPDATWPVVRLGEDAAPPAHLSEFIISLFDEIREGPALRRTDWEYIAGNRFVAAVLQPTMAQYVRRTALGGALAVLLLDALYFAGFFQLRRWIRGRKPPGSAVDLPPKSDPPVQGPPK
jgi:hypothetical protein